MMHGPIYISSNMFRCHHYHHGAEYIALRDDGDYIDICWSCFNVNFNVNFKIVFNCLIVPQLVNKL